VAAEAEFEGEVAAAPAKLNLSLAVLGRRPDGYHELESLVAFAGYGDCLEALPAETLSLSLDGPFAAPLAGEGAGNLVLRAARLLAEAAGVPARARLRLTKRLPVAAGLGGGSADAAATLRLLSRLWGLELSTGDLQGLGAMLGADVPVCLYGRPALLRGRGERLEAAPPLPAAWLLLVNPGDALLTATVFRARFGAFSRPAAWWRDPPADAAALADRLSDRGNDLQAAAQRLCPAIDAVLAALAGTPGCLLGRMTGSGATCFGLYAGAAEAEAAAAALAATHPAWWVRAAPLLRDGERP